MKFIKLTQPNEEPIFINLEKIKEMYVSKSAESTVIIFDNEHSSNVKQTPEEILNLSELYIYNNYKS